MTRSLSSRVLVGLVVAACALGMPHSDASAQSPADIRAELSDAAKTAFDRGMQLWPQLFKAKDITTAKLALDAFRRAYELSNNSRVLYYVGMSERFRDQLGLAMMTFEQALADPKLPAADRTRIEQVVKALRSTVGKVQFRGKPAGALVLINDVIIGQTPFTDAVYVARGEQKIEIRKEGFEPLFLKRTFVAGDEKNEPIDFALKPTNPETEVVLDVAGVPAGRRVKITIDGVEVAELVAPPYRLRHKVRTPVGEKRPHEFRAYVMHATMPNKYEFDVRVTQEMQYQEDPYKLALTLARVTNEGRVKIQVEPAGSLIEIDGTVRGATLWDGTLSAGSHQVKIKKPGYEEKSAELVVQPGDDLNRSFTLNLERSYSWIWWTAGAVAVVGGAAVVSYFVLKPADLTRYSGNFNPGLVPGSVRW